VVSTGANAAIPTEEHLTLRCHAHNALAAEEDFGRERIREKRGVSDPASAANSTSEPVLGADDSSGPAPARRIEIGGE
jgi:hypothetical protein